MGRSPAARRSVRRRSGVVDAMLGSTEYRSLVVKQLYGATAAPPLSVAGVFHPALHRKIPPAAAEVDAWVNSGLDVLSIETAFAGGSEYFTNG